jgi:hypothetical protein
MIGTTRHKSKLDLPSKILAAHRYIFSVNALIDKSRKCELLLDGCAQAIYYQGFTIEA